MATGTDPSWAGHLDRSSSNEKACQYLILLYKVDTEPMILLLLQLTNIQTVLMGADKY